MIIITTEKPSVAQEYAKVLKVERNSGTDGYIQGNSDIMHDIVCITWCVGHLCTLSYPEKYDEDLASWKMETLPFLPKKYKYEVIPNVKKQFGVIKKIYNNAGSGDTIYYAGDAGREGLYIQMLVRQMAGVDSSVDERIVWIDSYTETEILRGIKEAKPVTAYERQTKAAYMRAIEDYAVGINFSRALSLKFGNYYMRATKSKGRAIAVGRVMTCVLSMVVQKEREIKNFVETNFYGIGATANDLECYWKETESSKYFESSLLYDKTGFKERKTAEDFISELQKNPSLTVEDVKESTEKKKAPLLFNLAEIQFFCSKKYKMSPDETLAIIQSLYEKKIVTYPRTDARVLSSAVAGEIKNNLSGLLKNGYKKEFIEKILNDNLYKNLEKTQYVDDSKITDHYAIIPTGYTQGFDTLTAVESNIYHDIIDRFVSIFYPEAVYQKYEVILKHPSNEKFFLSQKTLQNPGYLAIFEEEAEDNTLSTIQKGTVLNPVEFKLKEGKTTPPKRYTSGSMVIAMENAGKMIEEEELREQIKGAGIGTSATRAAIIQKLIDKEYIALNKKTQALSSTERGEILYDIVASTIPEFLKPNMTASWEKGLAGIENGSVTYEVYEEKLNKYITDIVNKIKTCENEYSKVITGDAEGYKNESSIVCPKCKKGHIFEGKKVFSCSEYKNGCDFVIWKTIAGKELPMKIVEKIITNGHTGLIKGFKSKSGKTFDAKLKLEDNKVIFDFPKKEN